MLLATYQPYVEEKGKNPLDVLMETKRRYSDYFGFNPVWCIPMTTPADFLAHSMFSTPSLSTMLYIVDTDEYIRIDKLEHCRRIMEEDDALEHLTCREDDRYCEFIVDAKELENGFAIPLGQNYSEFTVLGCGTQLSTEVRTYMHDISQPFNHMRSDVSNIPEIKAFFGYDENLYHQGLRGKILKKKFEACALVPVWNLFMKGKVTMAHADAVNKDLHKHTQVYNQFVEWFKGGCSVREYDRVYDSAKAMILDDEHALEALRGTNPGRNDLCPCGSGKKFKKCHGPYGHSFTIKT